MGCGVDARLTRLDHLRFLASFAVMSWHFTPQYLPTTIVPRIPFLSIIEEGHTGVAFFCVISGFIFAWLYGERDIEYGAFLKRRAFRILPLFLAIMLLSFFVLGGAWPVEQVLHSLTTLHVGGLPGYIAAGWSALVEVQFYLIFPFLMLFARRYGWRYLVGLFALVVSLRIIVWLDTGDVQKLAYWTMFGRIDQFLAGMIAGVLCKPLVNSVETFITKLSLMLGGIGAISIIGVYAAFNKGGGYTGFGNSSIFWAFLPAIEAICYSLIVAGYLMARPFPNFAKGRISGIFAYLGRISYSMYLTHVLVFVVVHKLIAKWVGPLSLGSWEAAWAVFMVTGFPAVIALSSATYALIERPFLELNRVKIAPTTADVIPIQTGRIA